MKRWPAAITVAVYIVSSLPYLYGYVRQSADERFTGIVFDVADTAQYFAWMRSFSHTWLIANPLTPDPGSSRFFNLQWWLLGLLAHYTPLGAVATFQVLRVAALAAFALALAAFCRRCAPNVPNLAFATVMLSSGFGWMLVVAKQWTGELRFPLDVQIAEANTFFSAMAFPHLLLAAAMMLVIFTLMLRSADGGSRRALSLIVVLTLALGFSHGYDLIPTMGVPLVFVAVLTLRDRRVPRIARPVAAIVVGGVAPALYSLSLTRLDATWSGVLKQYGNAGVYTPSPPHLIVLLGLPFLLAMWQIRPAAWRALSNDQLFVRVWLVAGFALLYIPTDYQIKMLTAYQAPVGLLAVETLRRVNLGRLRWPTLARWAPRVVPAAFVATIVLTNVYLTIWRVVDLRRANYPYYLAASDVRALESVARLSNPGEIVLSSSELGVFVPVYSDARPYVAHWAQTLDFYARRRDVAWFFAPSTTNDDREKFVRSRRIDFVLAGPAEAALNVADTAPMLGFDQVVTGKTVVYRARRMTQVQP